MAFMLNDNYFFVRDKKYIADLPLKLYSANIKRSRKITVRWYIPYELDLITAKKKIEKTSRVDIGINMVYLVYPGLFFPTGSIHSKHKETYHFKFKKYIILDKSSKLFVESPNPSIFNKVSLIKNQYGTRSSRTLLYSEPPVNPPLPLVEMRYRIDNVSIVILLKDGNGYSKCLWYDERTNCPNYYHNRKCSNCKDDSDIYFNETKCLQCMDSFDDFSNSDICYRGCKYKFSKEIPVGSVDVASGKINDCAYYTNYEKESIAFEYNNICIYSSLYTIEPNTEIRLKNEKFHLSQMCPTLADLNDRNAAIAISSALSDYDQKVNKLFIDHLKHSFPLRPELQNYSMYAGLNNRIEYENLRHSIRWFIHKNQLNKKYKVYNEIV